MSLHKGMLTAAAALLVLLSSTAAASAAIARYHYAPNGPNGAMTFVPSEPTEGERISVFGTRPDPNPPRPTVMMTYRHPTTGQTINVPLRMPEGTPTVYHRRDRIVYNFSGYTVQVLFLPDGSVDVIYNSGFLRAL
jgi:hypothetical protein